MARAVLRKSTVVPFRRLPPAVAEAGIEPLEDWEPSDELLARSEVAAVSQSCPWSRLEKDLFLQSGGTFEPTKMRRLRRVPGASAAPSALLQVAGRASVVIPTTDSRLHYHERIWKSFVAQDWPDKELVIVETYEASETGPSPFFLQKAKEDSRVVFVSFPISDEDEDFTIGLKRDMALHLASGEFVLNFDDDDLYSARYTKTMIGDLQARGLQALTFSSWHNYFEYNATCGYSDADTWDDERVRDNEYGFGFSYVHRRAVALSLPYPNLDFAEDVFFMYQLMRVCGDSAVGLRPDHEGLCMHIIHDANTTIDPEYSHPVSAKEVLALEVSKLDAFQDVLRRGPTSWWHIVVSNVPLPALGWFLVPFWTC